MGIKKGVPNQKTKGATITELTWDGRHEQQNRN